MATIIIDIGNSGTRINNAFSHIYAYQPIVEGQPNSQTLPQFTKAKVGEYVKSIVKQYEATEAAEIARTQAMASVDSQVVIT